MIPVLSFIHATTGMTGVLIASHRHLRHLDLSMKSDTTDDFSCYFVIVWEVNGVTNLDSGPCHIRADNRLITRGTLLTCSTLSSH